MKETNFIDRNVKKANSFSAEILGMNEAGSADRRRRSKI
jgi:hypothetical protein